MIATQPVPAIVVHTARRPHRLALGISVDLDKGNACFPYSEAVHVEPDNSEFGVDGCGSPRSANVIVRVNGYLVARTSVRLTGERGRLRLVARVVKGPARWSVTVLNPIIGRNTVVRGVA